MAPDAAVVRARFESDETTVVTLTVTEKGYHRRADTGELDLTAPAIADGLPRAAAGDAPHTMVGLLGDRFGRRPMYIALTLATSVLALPLLAATLTAVTGSWWPIAVMMIGYSLITLVSAWIAPETRGRDLVRLEDAL